MKQFVIIFCLLFILLITSCKNLLLNTEGNGKGAIYGRIYLSRTDKAPEPIDKKEVFKRARLFIKGSNCKGQVDSAGIFYITGVPPGKYKLIARAPDFFDGIINNIDVAEDSISIVIGIGLEYRSKYSRPFEWEWQGTKIKIVDINRKGNIIGHVNSDFFPIKDAGVYALGVGQIAYTDSTGFYRSRGILPGHYTIEGRKPGWRITKVLKVRVAPDSASIVDMSLTPGIIPEDPLPYDWIEKIIKE